MKKRRVGIFGGSFAPVHRGHLGVAANVLAKGLADEVRLLPCRRNPLKDTVAMSDGERLALLRDAVDYMQCEDDSLRGRIKVDDIELSMPEPSYTWQTMERLSRENPDCEFSLIIGADSYLDFGRWKRSGWLAENFHPIVFPRPGYPVDKVEEGFRMLDGVEEFDISSTAIREGRIEGETMKKQMPWIKI